MAKMRIRNTEHNIAAELSKRRHWLCKLDNGRFNKTAVARALGITPQSYSLWESGTSCPATFDTWKEWAEFLGMNLNIELGEQK